MKKHHSSLFRLLGSASIFQIVLSINVFAEIKRDYDTYPVPPPPPLPAAGGTIIDPTFETTIMRLTDANDGPDCVNAYSYWPTFNVNNTRLLVYSGIAPLLYRFDEDTLRLLRVRYSSGPRHLSHFVIADRK